MIEMARAGYSYMLPRQTCTRTAQAVALVPMDSAHVVAPSFMGKDAEVIASFSVDATPDATEASSDVVLGAMLLWMLPLALLF